MCRSSWESYELLFFSVKRLFSQLVSVRLLIHLSFFLCSYATSHSFPVSADGGYYYPPTMHLLVLLFYLRRSDDDYRRLIVYGCERIEKREAEREQGKEKEKMK